MALLILARHAQASFGAANYDELSDLGRQQARWLGEHLRTRNLTLHSVHAGSLVRQQDTAREVLQAMGMSHLPVATDPGFNEYHAEPLVRAHLGITNVRELQKTDYKKYWRLFREAMQAWAADELANVPETWTQFGERMHRAMRKATEGADRDDVVLVVSSGGAISRGIADLLQAPPATAIELNMQLRNTAFCELIVGQRAIRLVSFNAMPHLDTAERRDRITAA
ncbi:MAG: histidine phosphatase family protein [Burkholderiaceae bacterium]